MQEFLSDELTKAVIGIAREAGAAVMSVYDRDDFGLRVKSDNSPLTEADLASNEVIVRGLNALTPNIPVLSEESKAVAYAERKDWQQFWLVDPLDGTKEFVRRNGEFTVNIALIEHGEPVFGVVYVPVQNRMYFGGPTTGAFVDTGLEPKPIRTAAPNETAIVAVSRSHLSEADETFIAELAERYGSSETIAAGSSLKLCLVADGRAHAYPRFGPTMEWDTAAAHAIVTGAGGRVLDAEQNQPLTYNKENLLNPYFVVLAAGV